ncbi:MAG: hypothetical protein FH749_08270 [Firmicutes bacterium]|nr:hypothetical protein [Bacillota bacterium]
MKKFHMILICTLLTLLFIPGCLDLMGSHRADSFGQGTKMDALHTLRTPQEVVERSIAAEVEFLHPYAPFSFPVEHALAHLSPLEISSDGKLQVSVSGSTWSESLDWPGTPAGTSQAAYEIEELTIDLQLTENKLVTSSDGKRQIPILAGEGTFSYKAQTSGSMKTKEQNETWSSNISDNFTISARGKVSIDVAYERLKDGDVNSDQDRADLMTATAIRLIFESEDLDLSGSTELGTPPFANNNRELISFKAE